MKYAMCLVTAYLLTFAPAISEMETCQAGAVNWRSVPMPAEIAAELPDKEVARKFMREQRLTGETYTVLAAPLNDEGTVGYLIRENFNAGQHQAPALLYMKAGKTYRLVLSTDVNNTKRPLIIMSKKVNDYYMLCDPIQCCGENEPIMYSFDGVHYHAEPRTGKTQ